MRWGVLQMSNVRAGFPRKSKSPLEWFFLKSGSFFGLSDPEPRSGK